MTKKEIELMVAIIVNNLCNMQIKQGMTNKRITELKRNAIKNQNWIEEQELINIKGSLTFIDRQLGAIKDYFNNIYYKRYSKKERGKN